MIGMTYIPIDLWMIYAIQGNQIPGLYDLHGLQIVLLCGDRVVGKVYEGHVSCVQILDNIPRRRNGALDDLDDLDRDLSDV